MARKAGLVFVAGMMALAGCQSDGGSPAPRLATPQPSTIEGQWAGTDGVAVSTFQGGKFTSTAVATGEVLTEGTYTVQPSGLIQIQFYSVRAQKDVAANCLIADRTRLNCTLDSGTQFSLLRKGTA